jgi:hypothetical protein
MIGGSEEGYDPKVGGGQVCHKDEEGSAGDVMGRGERWSGGHMERMER